MTMLRSSSSPSGVGFPEPGARPRVPFLELKHDDEARLQVVLAAVEKVLRHGRLVLGPEVQEFEQRIAARCGRQYGVAVNSGSTALWLGLRALGVGPGDEVITTPLSWVATANAIAMTGAVPVFADIGDDLNLDPATIEPLITTKTKAVVPVHYTGKMCDMPAICRVAAAFGLLVAEDAAQAFDATLHGRRAGSVGDVGCFSMNAMKVFAACGDAGLVVTDREDVRDRVVRLRYNGTINREQCVETSLNGRIDPLQAAILLERLAWIDDIIAKRQQVAAWYTERLRGHVGVPEASVDGGDVWYTYQIKVPNRPELKAFLESRGVEVKIQHPVLMPQQPVYAHCPGVWPNAARLVGQILCLPSTERLTREDVDYVCDAVVEFLDAAGAAGRNA